MAGTVVEAGERATSFRPGDAVYGTAEGAFAEYARARAGRLAAKPANLSFAQAAAVPVSGLTALQAVRDHAKVQAGERVLVIGASGGVGTFAVQLAKARGAHVTAVASTGKIDLVRTLGADEVVDYTREDISGRYDAILDIGGNRPLSRLRRALTPHGRLVIVGGENGGRWLGGTDRQLRAQALSPLVSQKLGTFVTTENAEDLNTRENAADLDALRELIEAGTLTAAVDREYPLDETPTAIHRMMDGQVRGKVVIVI